MQQILPFALLGFGLFCGLALVIITHLRGKAVCFVRGLSDAQLKLLSDRQIWYEAARLAGAIGVHIKRRDQERACETLASYVLTEFTYSRFGTTEVALQPNVQGGLRDVFSVGTFTEGFKDKLTRLVKETILPVVQESATIFDCRGRDQANRSDRYGYNIGFHAMNAGMGGQDLPEVLCGYRHGLQMRVSAASLRGVPLVDPETGFVFGELVDKALALFVPLEKKNKVLLPIIAKLLEIAAKEMNIEGIVDEWAAGKTDQLAPNYARTSVNVILRSRNQRREAVLNLLGRRILGTASTEYIGVRDYGEQPAAPIQNGQLQVHYAAQAIGLRGVDSVPSGLGLPIVVDGKLVGELMPNNLFVYKDQLRHGSRADIYKLADIFYAARRIADSQDKPRVADDLAVAECLNLVRPLFAAQAPSAEAVAGADEVLGERMRAAREFEQEQLRLDTTSDYLLGEEFDSIFRLKQVLDVQVTDRELLVTTDTLYCPDERTGLTHKIGRFEIHLPYDGNRARFINKDGLVRNMNAPHVDSDGHPCLGTIKDMLPNLIKAREFAEAVQVSIAFLESANTDDHWGKYVDKWPVAATGIVSRVRRFSGI